MPHVTLKLYIGRSEDEKRRIADAVAQALIASAGVSDASVSVSVEDVEPSAWPDVYRDEIIGKPDTLFRKPGYVM